MGLKFLISLLFTVSLYSQETVIVTRVVDGDTFYSNSKKFRIAEIDAPELTQQYGLQSKVFLSKLIQNKEVRLYKVNIDRYGREVVRVYRKHENVAETLVKTGQAWVSPKYVRNPNLPKLQIQAKRNKIGLWRYPAIPPEQYRRIR